MAQVRFWISDVVKISGHEYYWEAIIHTSPIQTDPKFSNHMKAKMHITRRIRRRGTNLGFRWLKRCCWWWKRWLWREIVVEWWNCYRKRTKIEKKIYRFFKAQTLKSPWERTKIEKPTTTMRENEQNRSVR